MNKILIFAVVTITFVYLLTACRLTEESSVDTSSAHQEGDIEMHPSTTINKQLSPEIESLCKSYYLENELISLNISIVTDGEVQYYSYGYSTHGGNDVDEYTLYEIASLSKVFTATLLADMASEGLISLDDPAQKYLNEQQVILPKYEGESICIKHLATHTSGLPKLPIGFKDSTDPYANLDVHNLYNTLNKQVLFRTPGMEYQYSNYAYALLGNILCEVDNKSYDQLLSDRLGSVIGMENTAVNLTDKQQQSLALPHSITGNQTPAWNFLIYESAGGLKSNAKDMAQFLLAHLYDLCTEELSEAIRLTQQVHYDNDRKMGLGWHIGSINGFDLYDHTGETGGYLSYLAIVPECDAGIFITTNCKKKIIPLGEQLLHYLVEDN